MNSSERERINGQSNPAELTAVSRGPGTSSLFVEGKHFFPSRGLPMTATRDKGAISKENQSHLVNYTIQPTKLFNPDSEQWIHEFHANL